MTDHLRRLAIYVDEPDPGVFHWVLIESTEDAAIWEDLDSSEEAFDTWMAAWDAGCVAMHKLVLDERVGPRAPGEDESASPVG